MENVLKLAGDQAILTEFREGDADRAADAFVRAHQDFVFATALRYLQDRDDAGDASQEAFIKALASLGNFRGESSIRTWLYRITVNVCSSMKRRKTVRSMLSLDGIGALLRSRDSTPEQALEDQNFRDNFDLILAQLPPKQRETFVLRYFDELSYEEISQMLGTSVGGLKANYYQATKKIAQLLESGNYE